MELHEAAALPAGTAWSGPDLATIPEAMVKLRWTDQPYHWHVNDGGEVFAVLAGVIDMHARAPDGTVRVVVLRCGDVLHIRAGETHAAHPRGAASILVVEQKGSA